MQLWIPSAAAIYLASYLPLSIILLAQDIDFASLGNGPCRWADLLACNCVSPLQHPAWSVSLVALCVVCFAVSVWTLHQLPAKLPITVVESKHIPADLINYVVPYVLSFITISFDDNSKLLGFGIFLGWIFWITYKSGQIAMNPVLAVLGWKLFEVKYSHLNSPDVLTGRVLSRVILHPSQVYRHTALQDVMIVNEEPREIDR